MFNLKEKYINKWNMFESGNFSMNKSDISFSTIGRDHALKQENRVGKILSGIKGIGNDTFWDIYCEVFKYGVFPGPCFSAFELNTDQKNSVFGYFSRSDYFLTAAEMRNIVDSFYANLDLDYKEAKKRKILSVNEH